MFLRRPNLAVEVGIGPNCLPPERPAYHPAAEALLFCGVISYLHKEKCLVQKKASKKALDACTTADYRLFQLLSEINKQFNKCDRLALESDELVLRCPRTAAEVPKPSGYGDADPSNVSSMVRGAELRIAETRAVNRALRKAYGIGLCSVEELGAFSSAPRASTVAASSNGHSSNGNGNGQPRLRDQLCLLIRQYSLDANLVKAYAADFCGTRTLSGASRELVESFISHLAGAAKQNRDALVCKLNSYAQPVEARS